MIQREFTADMPRRMSTLKRRWADPEPTPEPVVEPAATHDDVEPSSAEPGPVVAYKPAPAPPGPRPPHSPHPPASGIVINVTETPTPSPADLAAFLSGSLARRQQRVRPDNV